jgi:hypothetical protein
MQTLYHFTQGICTSEDFVICRGPGINPLGILKDKCIIHFDLLWVSSLPVLLLCFVVVNQLSYFIQLTRMLSFSWPDLKGPKIEKWEELLPTPPSIHSLIHSPGS